MKKMLIIPFLAAGALAAEDCDCCDDCCYEYTITLDILGWKAKEQGLDYVIKNQNGAGLVNNGKIHRADFDWNAGFRLGFEFGVPSCATYYQAVWTRFCTSGTDSVSATFPDALFPIWTNPSSMLISEEKIKAKVELDLNTLDLLMGTYYTPQCNLDLKPFIGLSLVFIDQEFDINASGGRTIAPFAFVLDDDIDMQNNYWGIGPKIGVDSQWHLGCGMSILGNIDLAAVYGNFNIKQREEVLFSNDVAETVYLDVRDDDLYLARINLDLLLGLRWDTCFCDGRYRFWIEAAWEQLYFFGQNQLMRFVDDQNPGVHVPGRGDLTIQGVTFQLGFTF